MKKIIALSALVAALASVNAMAADANLTFTGSVTSGTCTMNAADATKTLTIPDVSVATLLASTNVFATQSASSTIGFTNCPSSVSAVKLVQGTTTGTQAISGNASNYVPASGTAKNTALVLTVGGVYPSLDGSVISQSFATTSTGTASVTIQAGVRSLKSLISSAADPTAGTYSSSYTLTFAWS